MTERKPATRRGAAVAAWAALALPLLSICIVTLGCEQKRSRADSWLLAPEELADLERKAQVGDGNACFRLYVHYNDCVNDREKAKYYSDRMISIMMQESEKK